MIETLIQLNEISSIRSERALFSDFNLSISKGECLQIVGPNGSGKTTLLRLIAGLLKPQSGQVIYQENLSIFYLGHLNAIKLELSVLENIILYQQHKLSPQVIKEVLADLSLTKFAETLCQNLSQGQRQRVALAKMILSDSVLWILDEPFTALDQIGIAKIQHYFLEKLAKNGAIIVSTHQRLTHLSLPIKTIELAGEKV